MGLHDRTAGARERFDREKAQNQANRARFEQAYLNLAHGRKIDAQVEPTYIADALKNVAGWIVGLIILVAVIRWTMTP